MKRINVLDDNGNFGGWFNLDAAKELAGCQSSGGPYIDGRVLYATAAGRLVVNEWTNSGTDYYRFAKDRSEVAEILVRGGYDDNAPEMLEILEKYEV